MSISASRFQHKILIASPDLEKYELYKAALEWDVVEPIVIEDRGDVQSEKKWRNLVEPYHHQITNLITFCRRLPVTLLSDDVGLGKTISAGLIASELISRNRISKILIICPKILREQWKEELETKFNIPSVVVKSGEQFIKECRAKKKGAIIATYTTGSLHLDKIQQGDFDMLILDEAHKLRNLYGVLNTPQVAKNFSKALSKRLFKYVLMLTATPIQNRLWDLYSLVDLLTVARGHVNPFGSPAVFARRFIADNRSQARRLKPEMTTEFRSIVYGYMSRVRREDAKLYFPDRVIQIHLVEPTPEELNLIKVTTDSIANFLPLLQITILKILISSPEALEKLLDGMVIKGTAQPSLVYDMKLAIKQVKLSTKLKGLFELVKKLKSEQPSTWRMVVFTTSKETQTTILCFLESYGISCGLINGESNSRNQESIEKFKKDEPEVNVIISTEAGSEGVNLQVANVLVNYDLPWNPMVVEQRIGRIQRLSSKHAKVCIFNIILKGTFEEYIVGRLMEKLQMASHAVGDIESLLEATGITEEEGSGSFEQKIRKLVMDSLAGKDVEEAMKLSEKSIADAKEKLESEEKNINAMLGGSIEQLDYGPTSPKLSKAPKSMDYKTLVLNSLRNSGGKIEELSDDQYFVKLENNDKTISFDENKNGTLYAPGSPDFENLINKIVSSSLHCVKDDEKDTLIKSENIARDWIKSFGANFDKLDIQEVSRCFSGKAMMRIRATVAHDSYERIVEAECLPTEHFFPFSGKAGIEPIQNFIENPTHIGVSSGKLSEAASKDPDILEFCRFYLERREREMNYAGEDFGKRKKLEDEFTPRLEISLVGLEGDIHRELKMRVFYNFEHNAPNQSIIAITPSTGDLAIPRMEKCALTHSTVPYDCLSKCEISKELALNHLLSKSEISNRLALPTHIIRCSLSGKSVLIDEVEKSVITGEMVSKSLLKTSSLSGKKAEPKFLTTCEFTNSDVLENETKISQVSGKKYRIDEEMSSSLSGKSGHKSEFIFCSETNQPLLETESEKCEVTGKVVKPGILEKCELTEKKVMPIELEKSTVSGQKALKKFFVFCSETNQPLLEIESEKCEVTGKIVKPGILEKCEITEKKVMPTELEKSAISGKKALKKFFISSNLSETRLLENEAVRSITGKFCAPLESKLCYWSEEKYHPEDLKNCDLTGLPIHSRYMMSTLPPRLENLFNLLVGTNNKTDQSEKWEQIANKVAPMLEKGNCKIKAAELSPTTNYIAVFIEAKSWVGLKVRHIGLLYSLKENNIIGRAAVGKLESNNWMPLKN